MATQTEVQQLQRQLLQKLFYEGQPVVSNPELKAIIDEQIEVMVTTLCGDIEVSFLPVDVSSSSEIILPGVAGYKIRVVQASLMADGDAAFTYYSDSTPISGDFSINTSRAHNLGPASWGWFDTESGEDLIIEKTGDGNIGGQIGYILIAADPIS